jgi:hypothetical protein
MMRMLLLGLILAVVPLHSRVDSASPTATPAVEVAESCDLNSNLITWFPAEIECPVCKTKNIFLEVGSYGNYIYEYPSKYQLIFWPFTDSPSWYSCKKCRYTNFMGAFAKPPAEKISELRKVLAVASLPPQKDLAEKEARDRPPYLAIPVSARMLVAEKVERTLGNMDDEFWSHFYRVLGYHFATEGNAVEADGARRTSLELTEKMLADAKHEGKRKELLYVAAAMKHFLRQDDDARKLLTEAAALTYVNKDLEGEQDKGYDAYLSKLIKEYLEMLKKGEGPAKMKVNADY